MDDFTKKSVEKFDSATVRKAEKLIDKSPELKRLRSLKDGESYNSIRTGQTTQAYRDNWDKIFGGNRENVNHRDKKDSE